MTFLEFGTDAIVSWGRYPGPSKVRDMNAGRMVNPGLARAAFLRLFARLDASVDRWPLWRVARPADEKEAAGRPPQGWLGGPL